MHPIHPCAKMMPRHPETIVEKLCPASVQTSVQLSLMMGALSGRAHLAYSSSLITTLMTSTGPAQMSHSRVCAPVVHCRSSSSDSLRCSDPLGDSCRCDPTAATIHCLCCFSESASSWTRTACQSLGPRAGTTASGLLQPTVSAPYCWIAAATILAVPPASCPGLSRIDHPDGWTAPSC